MTSTPTPADTVSIDCPICHRTRYWCNGHGPAPIGSGAPTKEA